MADDQIAETDDKEETIHQENDDKSSSKSSVKAKPAKGNIANFQGKYFINLSREIPEYSTTTVKAYSTGTSENSMEGYFTVMCDKRYTPRTNITKSYQEISSVTLPKLAGYGRAIMPDGTACFCYIYQNNLGKRIYDTDQDIALGWKAEKTLETLVLPIVNALKELQQRDMTHGNIRITNLYDGGKQTVDKIMLGECLSVPASLNQPALFEPIERAMADPIGRGTGSIKDDLYSLGVLIAMHMRNFDPLRGKNDDEIISSKVVHGSYGALVGASDRLSSGLTDLLRGLLTDSEKNRWSLDEVFEWLDGRRITVNQSVKVKKAARGIKFDGISFFYAKTLAHKLMQRPQEAVHLIENHELSHWVERSLSNTEMLERLNMAISSAQESGVSVGYWDRLLPRVSIALDPTAPIRFKSMSLHLSAIGNALADAFAQKKGLENFVELFNNGIVYFWITICANLSMDVNPYVQQFDKIKGYLRQKGMVNGIERCLYFLNPSIHCLSPLVIEYFATDPKEYLLSLETVAEQYKDRNYPPRIIDKHAACFLISRDSRLIEPYVFDLSSELDYRYILANLNILANIQRFTGAPNLPHLAEWICSQLNPLIERYHDKETQISIRKDIEKKKVGGNLSEILRIIENPEKIKKDQLAYRKAMGQFRELEKEALTIAHRLEKPRFYSERTGREWAATISGVISALIILGFIMVHFGSEAPL